MARKPRLIIHGAFYHVMVRGNNGQEIFFTEHDRKIFYGLIHEGVIRFRYRVHAFCLMSNHVHFLLETGEVSISKIMQNICFRYTRWVNKSRNKIGHLFQGRFKSKLVETEQYLLQLIHYIHLNPTEAGMVVNPSHYRWSSHRAYLQMEKNEWLTTDYILSLFGSTAKAAIISYSKFIFKNGSPATLSYDKEDNCFNKRSIRIEQLTSKLEIKISNVDEIITLVCNQYHINEADLRGCQKRHEFARIRALIACVVTRSGRGALTSIARNFNRDVTGLIRTLRRLEQDQKFQEEVNEIASWLNKSTSQA